MVNDEEAQAKAREKAREAHQANIQVLFSNEALLITVLQALTGGAMFTAIAGAERLIELIGEWQFLVFLTTADLALLASVLAAWGKHQYKKWDVKANASGDQTEAATRSCKANFYLVAMRWTMAIAVTAFSIVLIEMPVFAWMGALKGE